MEHAKMAMLNQHFDKVFEEEYTNLLDLMMEVKYLKHIMKQRNMKNAKNGGMLRKQNSQIWRKRMSGKLFQEVQFQKAEK
jgi:hypothetical protein